MRAIFNFKAFKCICGIFNPNLHQFTFQNRSTRKYQKVHVKERLTKKKMENLGTYQGATACMRPGCPSQVDLNSFLEELKP